MPLLIDMTSNKPVASTVSAVVNSSLSTTLSSQREPSPRVNENSSSNGGEFLIYMHRWTQEGAFILS